MGPKRFLRDVERGERNVEGREDGRLNQQEEGSEFQLLVELALLSFPSLLPTLTTFPSFDIPYSLYSLSSLSHGRV